MLTLLLSVALFGKFFLSLCAIQFVTLDLRVSDVCNHLFSHQFFTFHWRSRDTSAHTQQHVSRYSNDFTFGTFSLKSRPTRSPQIQRICSLFQSMPPIWSRWREKALSFLWIGRMSLKERQLRLCLSWQNEMNWNEFDDLCYRHDTLVIYKQSRESKTPKFFPYQRSDSEHNRLNAFSRIERSLSSFPSEQIKQNQCTFQCENNFLFFSEFRVC